MVLIIADPSDIFHMLAIALMEAVSEACASPLS
jgi:hypothetical protein